MKVCFWCTSFQSDIQTVAYHLASDPKFDIVVAMDEPDNYRQDAIWRIRPFQKTILDRRSRKTMTFLREFNPDVVVVDNHLPPIRVARKMLVLWHGLGWRIDDISTMRKELRKHVGDVTKENANFIWQAFGNWDRDYTISHRRIAPQNVVSLGSPYSDLLLPQSDFRRIFNPLNVADSYRFDVVDRKTVLVGMTWHHGGLFDGIGDETTLLDQLLHHIKEREANVIFRMHDRKRYDRDYLNTIERMIQKHDHVQLKFKSESPDSLVDMMVSDVMITNFSSFANDFYYTYKPCIHIRPSFDKPENLIMRRYKSNRVKKEKVCTLQEILKLPLEDNGGLIANSFNSLLQLVDQSLDDPSCCHEMARKFIERHIQSPNLATCNRITDLLLRW